MCNWFWLGSIRPTYAATTFIISEALSIFVWKGTICVMTTIWVQILQVHLNVIVSWLDSSLSWSHLIIKIQILLAIVSITLLGAAAIWHLCEIRYSYILWKLIRKKGNRSLGKTSFYRHPWIWFPARKPLRWRHNDHAGVSNHQHHGCLLNRLFRRKSKKTAKLRVTNYWINCANSNANKPITTRVYSILLSRNQWNKSHQISYTTDILIILLMGISRAGKGWKGPSFDMG